MTVPHKPLVYLAAPYSIPDPVANTNDVVKFASLLLDDGRVVPLVPHLTLMWHMIAPREYEEWLEYDLHLLKRCDGLYRMAGESTGADREVERAEEWGIPVFRSASDLFQWASEAWERAYGRPSPPSATS